MGVVRPKRGDQHIGIRSHALVASKSDWLRVPLTPLRKPSLRPDTGKSFNATTNRALCRRSLSASPLFNHRRQGGAFLDRKGLGLSNQIIAKV